MFSSKKPYSAVTVAVERLTSEQYEEDDLSGIPDLVEAIKLQSTGPVEAARALRKKLKYGNAHRQLRALTILDGLIQNAGPRFQRTFIDEPLLERLRVCGTSDLSDQEVRAKCKVLFAGWAREYSKTPGLEGIAGLYRQLPRRKQQVTQERSKVLKETERDPFEDAAVEEREEEENQPSSSRSVPRPSPMPVPASAKASSSTSFLSKASKSSKAKKDKTAGKKKAKAFNLEEEKPRMTTIIAEVSVSSTNLLNALQLINREHERVSDNANAVRHFESCKQLRRHILRYIQHVEAEQYLGALINANDQLVTALMTFEQLDRSIDADSDSEDEAAEQAHLYRMAQEKGKSPESAAESLAGLSFSKSPPRPTPPARPVQPPRPVQRPPPVESDEELLQEDDDDNPFGDRNAVGTPSVEQGPPKW